MPDPDHSRTALGPATRSVPTVVFDGDCAFCTTSASWIANRLARRDGTDAVLSPWQLTDLAAIGTTAERTAREVLWVARDGSVFGGAAAVAAWLRYRGGAYGLVGRGMQLPGVRTLGSAVYRMVARNRHRLPGGSPACALPDSQPSPPAS